MIHRSNPFKPINPAFTHVFQNQTKQALVRHQAAAQMVLKAHAAGGGIADALALRVFNDIHYALDTIRVEARAVAAAPKPATPGNLARSVGHRTWLATKGTGLAVFGVSLLFGIQLGSMVGLHHALPGIFGAGYRAVDRAESAMVMQFQRAAATPAVSVFIKRDYQMRRDLATTFKGAQGAYNAYLAIGVSTPARPAPKAATPKPAGRMAVDEWLMQQPSAAARPPSPAPTVSSIDTDATGLSRMSSVSSANSLYTRS
jgi:hypothetical protein